MVLGVGRFGVCVGCEGVGDCVLGLCWDWKGLGCFNVWGLGALRAVLGVGFVGREGKGRGGLIVGGRNGEELEVEG